MHTIIQVYTYTLLNILFGNVLDKVNNKYLHKNSQLKQIEHYKYQTQKILETGKSTVNNNYNIFRMFLGIYCIFIIPITRHNVPQLTSIAFDSFNMKTTKYYVCLYEINGKN